MDDRIPLPDLISLQGKVALVTGAGRGIGRAIALRLADAGAAVAVSDMDAAYVDAVAGEVRDAGGTALAVAADVSDEAAVKSMVRACMDELGGLDVMANDAGTFPPCPVLGMEPPCSTG